MSSRNIKRIGSTDRIMLENLAEKNFIIGPPGSGKTTTIVSFANQARHFDQKFRVITYSRSLAEELKVKVGSVRSDDGKEVSAACTLHSYAHHALGLSLADYVGESELKSFCKKFNVEYEGGHRFRTPFGWEMLMTDDECGRFLNAYDIWIGGLRSGSVCASMGDYSRDYDEIAKSLEEFKHESGLFDYSDIIEQFAESAGAEELDLLLVDETQDFTPLMWRAVENLAGNAQTVVYFTDPCQSIYGYRGAKPDLVSSHMGDATTFQLGTTHRFGSRIYGLASRILIDSHINDFVPFSPNQNNDHVYYTTMPARFLEEKGSKAILCRTQYFAWRLSKVLSESGYIPLPINERHENLSPWSWHIVHFINALHRFPNVSKDDASTISSFLPENMLVEKWWELLEKKGVSAETFPALKFPREEVFQAACLPPEFKPIARRWIETGIREADIVYIDTIHSAKGLEFEHTAVAIDIPRTIHSRWVEDFEARIFYTGLTRGRLSAWILDLGSKYTLPIGRLAIGDLCERV